MKTIITFTLLLFTLSVFSQTTREEVVERNKIGHKIEVNTYTGTGNGERLIKKTLYSNYEYEAGVSAQPTKIVYYGKYKEETSRTGTMTTHLIWGKIKVEDFDENGILTNTWKISDKKSDLSKITLLP